jgi:hypothetical protein
MRLPTLHQNLEVVRRGLRGTGTVGELTARAGPNMQAEHSINARVLHHARVDHRLGAAGWWRFLGRLEEELDRARQLRAHASQHLGNPHQHRDMGVMAAGVHDANLLASIDTARRTLEREVVHLGDRQRIHVSAQSNHRAGFAATKHTHYAMTTDACLHLHAQCTQMVGHNARRPFFKTGELRVLVNVPTPADHA